MWLPQARRFWPAGLSAALALAYLALGGAVEGLFLAGACFAAATLGSRLQKSTEADQAPPAAETPDAPGDLRIPAVLGLVERQIVVSPADLERVRAIIADAAAQLAASFGRVDQLVRAQQQQVASLLTDVGGAGETSTGAVTVNQLAANVAETAELLGRFVALVVTLSKRSMDIFYRVDEAAERLTAAQRLLKDVRWIANQTSMVAINATIEAARLGEAGAGFAVVAGEVRHLAQRARTVSEEIGAEITGSWEAAQAARATTQENAAQDLNVLLTSRVHIEGLAEGVRALERAIGDKLAAVTGLTGDIALETGAACRSLQFEDISRQILERCAQDLVHAASTVATVRQGLEQPDTGQDLVALAAALEAEHQQRAQHKPAQETIAAGEVELF